MIFTELADKWKTSKALFVKKSTMAAYLQILKNHVIPLLGHMPIEEIRSAHLQGMVSELMGKGLSVKSAKDVMIVVNMILKFGSENEFMPIVPYRVKYPSKNLDGGNKISVYTTDEQKK